MSFSWSMSTISDTEGFPAPGSERENVTCARKPSPSGEVRFVGLLITFAIHRFPSPGGTSETMSLFCAQVDAADANGIHGLADEHEDIRVSTMSADDALAAVARGEIISAPAVVALQWLAMNRDRLRARWRT